MMSLFALLRRSFAGSMLVATSLTAALSPLQARADGPAPDTATATFETRFMHEMIDHHMMAVHMGMTCLEKATHPELRAMCQQMVDAQQAEIAAMTQWLQAWYAQAHEHHHEHMPPGHHVRMEKLAALSGAEFEIAFMQEMTRHHRMAVVKASHCVARAWHEALQVMCEDMATTQLAEIRQMSEWLCHWYGICRRPWGS